jgi:predicted tellurium resistance membrane protein TerC
MSAIITIAVADISLSLDNVLGVAGAAKDHYVLLIFGLALSIVMMATMANYIAKWVKTYKWIGWLGLFAILIVAVDLIYADVKFFINQ